MNIIRSPSLKFGDDHFVLRSPLNLTTKAPSFQCTSDIPKNHRQLERKSRVLESLDYEQTIHEMVWQHFPSNLRHIFNKFGFFSDSEKYEKVCKIISIIKSSILEEVLNASLQIEREDSMHKRGDSKYKCEVSKYKRDGFTDFEIHDDFCGDAHEHFNREDFNREEKNGSNSPAKISTDKETNKFFCVTDTSILETIKEPTPLQTILEEEDGIDVDYHAPNFSSNSDCCSDITVECIDEDEIVDVERVSDVTYESNSDNVNADNENSEDESEADNEENVVDKTSSEDKEKDGAKVISEHRSINDASVTDESVRIYDGSEDVPDFWQYVLITVYFAVVMIGFNYFVVTFGI